MPYVWVEVGLGPPSYAPQYEDPCTLTEQAAPWCQISPPIKKKGKPEQLKTGLQLLLARLPPLNPSHTNPGCSFGISAIVPLRNDGLNRALYRYKTLNRGPKQSKQKKARARHPQAASRSLRPTASGLQGRYEFAPRWCLEQILS